MASRTDCKSERSSTSHIHHFYTSIVGLASGRERVGSGIVIDVECPNDRHGGARDGVVTSVLHGDGQRALADELEVLQGLLATFDNGCRRAVEEA